MNKYKENYAQVVQTLSIVLDRMKRGIYGVNEISFEGKATNDSLESDRFRPFLRVACNDYPTVDGFRRAFFIDGQETRDRLVPVKLTQSVEEAAEYFGKQLLKHPDYEFVHANGKYHGERSLFLQDPRRTGPTLKEVLYYSKEYTDGVPKNIPINELEKEVQSWEVNKDGQERLTYSIKDESINQTVLFKKHETTNVYRDKVFEGILKGDMTTIKELNQVIEKTFEKVFKFDR